MKIVCYGVRPNEVESFNKYNKYNFDLKLIEASMNHSNVIEANGMDAVLVRGTCIVDQQNIEKINSYGIRWIFTRATGTNNIDFNTINKYEMKVARVPGYSPNAIAELSLTLAMSLLRNVTYATNRTSQHLMKVTPQMFSKEIRNCTVGIIGMGRIGLVEANLYKGLGAKVIGYDIFQSDLAKETVEFVSIDELLNQSDIVSIHVPYIKGENDKMINAEFISKMKNDAILINTSRGDLQDNVAIYNAILNNEIYAFATDVLPNENEVFFQDFTPWKPMKDVTAVNLLSLYPRVLVTPHIGSNTDEALKNMIETSFENFNQMITTGTTDNLCK